MIGANLIEKIIKTVILTALYASIIGVFTIKTLYYYSYQTFYWLLYFVATTLAFIFWVYYSAFRNRCRIQIMLMTACFIGGMPFEVEITEFKNLIADPSGNLSGLASKLPLPLGILFDFCFYPLVTLILLALVLATIKPKTKQRSMGSGRVGHDKGVRP